MAQAKSDLIMRWAIPRGVGAARNFAVQIRSNIAQTLGDYEESYRLLEKIAPSGSPTTGISCCAHMTFDFVQAAVASGRREQALTYLRSIQSVAPERFFPHLALLIGASAALVEESEPIRTELFERVLRAPAVEGWRSDAARVRLAYGEHLRRCGELDRSQRQLRLAGETFARLRAAPWSARAEAELSSTRAPAGSSPAQILLSVELSPHERQVALLASAGLTSRQIAERMLLSPRTVGTYLHRLLDKLGAADREDLRQLLWARQAAPGSESDCSGERQRNRAD